MNSSQCVLVALVSSPEQTVHLRTDAVVAALTELANVVSREPVQCGKRMPSFWRIVDLILVRPPFACCTRCCFWFLTGISFECSLMTRLVCKLPPPCC